MFQGLILYHGRKHGSTEADVVAGEVAKGSLSGSKDNSKRQTVGLA